jgi:tripartite-type tricarboxylate transporter receptor subunit TctC
MKRYCLPILAGVAVAAAASIAQAQDYPTRQITLIAPWPAGGAVDAVCRAVASPLSDRLGKSVVVENRPGAGSVIGTAAGAKAAPDGYTMVMAGSGSLAISATMYKKLPYDPIKDLVPIALGAKIPFVLVANPSLPVRSVAELVQYAKNNPGKLSFASGGPGSPHHLYGELLKSMTGIEMTHVPYKGSAPALTDVIARPRAAIVLRHRAVAAADQGRQGPRARRIDCSPSAGGAGHPADRGGGRSRIRRRRLGRVRGAGRHAEGGRG